MVKILAVSDEELIRGRDVFIDNYINEDVDILMNCGDLSPSYMEYLIHKFKPWSTIMVHGNHDKKYYSDDVEKEDGFSSVYQGSYLITGGMYSLDDDNIGAQLNICGFSGAFAYGDWPFYYDEKRANSFVRRLKMKDFFNNLDQLDVMMTHSAPKIGDYVPDIDHHHRPSEEIAQIYEEFRPRLWLYGHIHPRYTNEPLDHVIDDGEDKTYLINTVPFKLMDYDPKTGDVDIINSL